MALRAAGQRIPRASLALATLGACVVSACRERAEPAREPALESAPVELTEAPTAPVRPGIEVLLEDSVHLVRGQRVGLITNQTGVDRLGTSSIDRLHETEGVELVALFSPEHGIRGAEEAGEGVQSGIDAGTGLPIHSLYGETLSPTPAMLAGVDVLVFDIQDVGTRYYTYLSTMTLAMEAAGAAGIPFVVLDRPNPIGGTTVQGNVLEPEFSTFVGRYPVPMRHGLTPGEFARFVAGEMGVSVTLSVAPAEGWTRDMPFEATGLPWIAPSPNMPSVESALHYPGTCLFEGTPISVGRGTEIAFQWIGAPWLDGDSLATALQAYGLPDTRFEAVRFTPANPGDGKFGGEEVGGVRFVAAGPAYDPTRAAVAALIETRRLSGTEWSWRTAHFDRLAGTDRLRMGIEEGASLDELTAEWARQLEVFERRSAPYLIYPR